MGFLDRLLGRVPTEQQQPQAARARTPGPAAPASRPAATDDERAVARYRYLLRTAPPEQLEAMHAEAFAALTPEQRQQLLRELATASPDDAGTSSEPADLARAATRAEMRRPGTLESTFSRGSSTGPGMGSMFAGSMMGTVAGVVVGSAVANMMFGGYEGSPEAQEVGDTGSDAGGDTGGDAGGDVGSDLGGDAGGDPGYASDGGGGDWAGGAGGWGDGGDFGGGDIGGGDFGGF
ncbi:MAG TPA: hypothetical protein VFU25_10875 [Ornithinibacter sp.]|nr:hypothetical protein [Ornithinibacter sp.]